MNAQLQGIDLTDSWVLGWRESSGALEFSIEFSLRPESAFYRTPKKDEWTCYRRGVLRFDDVTAVSGLKNEEAVRPTIDPDGSKDFGNIDSFEEQTYQVRLSGCFGDVVVACSSWRIEIE
jgi:hypothetical protein